MSDRLDKIPVKHNRFSVEELAERNRLMGLEEATLSQPMRFYSEDELDELYEQDPLTATRISRDQEMAKRKLNAARKPDPNAPPPDWDTLIEVLQEARQILLKDGGDLELVEVKGSVVRVRMKGNCVGCPNAVLDLKNVVEKIVMRHFPQVTEVHNTF